ncbi:hypothetical protein [Microbacterium mcarthurae (nom. nud.)]|uniref:WXG100 family type VII secretion target n=1 Tax=Microbacterium mcarthurae TaxID=3035918 RepID=A0ABW9GGD0_9MICO
MARSPIEIPIASETGAFKKGVDAGIIEPLEDAQRALGDLANSRGPAGLERDMRDAQKQTEKLRDETDRTVDAIEKDFPRAYRQVRQSADDGLGRARAAAEEVTQEIGSNLGEAVSSVRGDLSDLGQVGQDTLGGLAATVSGMGPAGLVGALALAAGAVGLGAVTAGLEEAEEQAERLKEQAAEWAQAYVDAGSTVLSTAQIIEKGQRLLVDEGDKVRNNAELWGVSAATAAAAMAGSQSAIDQVSRSLDRQRDALEANASGADNYSQNMEAATFGQSKANGEFIKGKKAFDELTGAMEIGRETADFVSQMMVDVARNTAGATESVDEFGDTVIVLPDGKKVYIDAETGRATQDVEAIEQKIYGIQDKTATVRLRLDSSEWDRWTPGAKVGTVRTAVAQGSGGGTTWF